MIVSLPYRVSLWLLWNGLVVLLLLQACVSWQHIGCFCFLIPFQLYQTPYRWPKSDFLARDGKPMDVLWELDTETEPVHAQSWSGLIQNSFLSSWFESKSCGALNMNITASGLVPAPLPVVLILRLYRNQPCVQLEVSCNSFTDVCFDGGLWEKCFSASRGFFRVAGLWLATEAKLTCSLKGLLWWFSIDFLKVGELTRDRFTLKGMVHIRAAEAQISWLLVASMGQTPITLDPIFLIMQWAVSFIRPSLPP